MKLPLEIVFRNLEPSEAIEARVRERAEKLERFYHGNSTPILLFYKEDFSRPIQHDEIYFSEMRPCLIFP